MPQRKRSLSKVLKHERHNKQQNKLIDVRARAAVLLSRCPLKFRGLGGSLSPRQFHRCRQRQKLEKENVG